MGTPISQASFTSGEISPSLFGRLDFARYYTGLKTCLNFIVRQFGGVTNRPGTRLCAAFKDSTKAGRLIPFEFNTSQAYVLEFTAGMIRIYKDGGLVVWPSGPDVGLPVEVTTIWAEADLPLLKTVQSADIMTICHPAYPTQQLSRTDHHLWALSAFENVGGPFDEINIDESKRVSVNSATGAVTITSNADIFTSDMPGMMIYLEADPNAQAASSRRWEVEKVITINDIRRAGSNYYQALSSGTTGTVRPSTLDGYENDGDPGVSWQYLHSGSGIVLISGFTSTKIVTGTVLSRLPETLVGATMAKNITAAAIGVGHVTVTSAVHGLSTGDPVTIAGVLGMTDLNGNWAVTVIDANTFTVPLTSALVYTSGGTATKTLTATASYKWALEIWGGSKGYPGATSYFQQRQVFGGSAGKPQSFWMSQTEGFKNFGVSVPVLDDEALAYTLNSRRVNEVRHFVELSKLIMLTSDGPFIITGGQDDLIAPGKISTKRQSASGCSHVAPLLVGSHALYIQEKGSQVRALGYSFADDAFIGQDMTVISSHLFAKHKLVDWAFQTVPYSVAWVVRDDGVLLGLTYMPEQEVIGWHRHSTDGFYESVSVISENDEDVLYLQVRREIGGVQKRFVERMATRSFPTMADAFFVDCGLTYDGRNATATTMTLSGGATWDHTEQLTLTASALTGVNAGAGFSESDLGHQIHFPDDDASLTYRFTINEVLSTTAVKVTPNKLVPAAYRGVAVAGWSFAHNVISGLEHLEGKTVAILSDGAVCPPQVVTAGAVTLGAPGSVVHVGLPYFADFETLSVSAAQQNIREKQKLITHVSMQLGESMAVLVGPDPDHLTEVKQDKPFYDRPSTELNELVDIRIQATWSKSGRIFVRQEDPLPITILSVIPDVSMGGA